MKLIKFIPLILLTLVLSGCYYEPTDKVACLYRDVKEEAVEITEKYIMDSVPEDCKIINRENNKNTTQLGLQCDGRFVQAVYASSTVEAFNQDLIKCQQVPNNSYWKETLPEAEEGTYWELN